MNPSDPQLAEYAKATVSIVQRLGSERSIRGIELWIANHLGDPDLDRLMTLHRQVDADEPLSHELVAVGMLMDFNRLWTESKSKLPDLAHFDRVADDFQRNVREFCARIRSIGSAESARRELDAERTSLEASIAHLRSFADSVEILKSIAAGSKHMEHNLAARLVREHCLMTIPDPEEIAKELQVTTLSIEEIDAMIRQTLSGTEAETMVSPSGSGNRPPNIRRPDA